MWKQLSILVIYSLYPDLPGTPAGSTMFHYFLRSPFSGAVLSCSAFGSTPKYQTEEHRCSGKTQRTT